MPAAAAAGGKFAHLSKEEKTQRLEQVKAALKQLKQQQELEFELDGVQQKRFQLEESLRPLKGAESKLAEAMAGMNAFEDLARVPPDFPRQLEMYTRLKIALDDEFRKADEKASSARRTAEDRPVFPPWSDRLFQIGLGVAVGAVAVGVGLAQALEMPSLRYLGLLDLGGFGAMGLSLLSYIGRLEAREALKEVGAVAAERKDKAQRRFDLDTSNVRKVLAELSLKDDKDLDVFRDRLAARSAAQARLDQVKQQVTETRAQSGGANSEELQKLTSRQAEIEGKLAGMGFTGSEKDLKVEQAALSAELGLGGGDEVEGDGYQSGYPQGGGGKGGSQASADDDERWPMLAPGSGGTSGAYAMSAGSPPGGGGPPMPYMMPGSMPPMMSGPPDSIMRLMKASLDLFHVPIEKVGPMVQPRAAQYLGAFADRRFSNLTFTDRGDAVAVDAQGKVLPYATMSMLDQDLVYLSVLLTLVETYAKQHKSPVIIDNWFAGLPDLKHPLLAKMLQYLASLTQVVHFCSKPGLAEGAEPKVVL